MNFTQASGTDALINDVSDLAITGFRNSLLANRKVATRKVIRSLKATNKLTPKRITVTLMANEGLKFINSGRRRGAKLPLKKEGDKFVLVDPLREWRDLVAPNIPDFLLARKISRDGIAPVPVSEQAIRSIAQPIERRVRTYLETFAIDGLVEQTRRILR